ncbi:MAG: hypothetical protein EA393_04295 [Bacteroidetes bacterium]|nr:MAG: hypothetical protein EA393_04295 [Bacteroidota bacterium]
MHAKTTYKIFPFLVFLLALTLVFQSCEDDPEFHFDINDLLLTQWGVPQMLRPPQDMSMPDMDAPTIFYPEGYVTIGPARTDFWSLRSSRTIFLEQSREIWFIIDLTSARLQVEKTRQTDGALLGEYLYFPME